MLEKITTIWTALMSWITNSITSAISLFYVAESGFTPLGELAMVFLGIGVVFLVIRVVQNILKVR